MSEDVLVKDINAGSSIHYTPKVGLLEGGNAKKLASAVVEYHYIICDKKNAFRTTIVES